MNYLWQDLRFSLRLLRSKPRFSLTAISAIALGVAASTVVFTFVETVLLRPLPYSEPDRLVTVLHTNAKSDHILIATADYFEFERRTNLLEAVGAIGQANLRLTGGDYAQEVPGSLVSGNLFSLLGITATVGRLFIPHDADPDADPVTLLSHSYWANKFGADPNVIGTTLIINRVPRTVIGVLPEGYNITFDSLPNPAQIWIPLIPNNVEKARHGAGSLRIIARLKPHISLMQAQQEIQSIADELATEYPKSNALLGAKVYALQNEVGGRARSGLLILMAAVALVLLIACANVANMLLARGVERQKEMAVRAALGARRGRIVQQLLTECILLSLVGGSIGSLVAAWLARMVLPVIPTDLPRTDEIGIDLRIILFTVGLSFVTGIVFGCWPALKASKADLMRALREQTDQVTSRWRAWDLRGIFIVAQLSLTLVLLVGAALTITSFVRLYTVDPGFNVDDLLTVLVARPRSATEDEPQWTNFFSQVIERLESAPGVEGAAAAFPLALGGSTNISPFTIEDKDLSFADAKLTTDLAMVSSAYFQVLGIRLVSGRSFGPADGPSATPVVIVNESFSRQFYAGFDPIGRRLRLGDQQQSEPFQIIGVVSNSRSSLNVSPRPQVYQHYLQAPGPAMYLVARSSAQTADLVGTIRATVSSIDRNQPVSEIAKMRDIWSGYMVETRFYSVLLGSFAGLALILAFVGIYGVISYLVSQRTREIGIRVAMGAKGSDILRLILGYGAKLTLFGLAIGLVASIIATRVMSGLLFDVKATDLRIYLGVSMFLFVVSLAACYYPARRASRLDPTEAIRNR